MLCCMLLLRCETRLEKLIVWVPKVKRVLQKRKEWIWALDNGEEICATSAFILLLLFLEWRHGESKITVVEKGKYWKRDSTLCFYFSGGPCYYLLIGKLASVYCWVDGMFSSHYSTLTIDRSFVLHPNLNVLVFFFFYKEGRHNSPFFSWLLSH